MDSTTVDYICGYCGRPIVGTYVWGSLPYHPECVHGPNWKPEFIWTATEDVLKIVEKLKAEIKVIQNRVTALEQEQHGHSQPWDF